MCVKKLSVLLFVLLCCASLFALPQFGSSRKIQPTEATAQSATEKAEKESEMLSSNSQSQPSEEKTEKKGIFGWNSKKDLAALNALYEEELAERDAELDKIQKMKFVAGTGVTSNVLSDDRKLGIEGYAGVQKGSLTFLGGVGYEDVMNFKDNTKEKVTGKLMLLKSF